MWTDQYVVSIVKPEIMVVAQIRVGCGVFLFVFQTLLLSVACRPSVLPRRFSEMQAFGPIKT